MAKTTKTDVIIPELFDEAVSGVFAQKGVFMDSVLAATSAAVISPTLSQGQADIGNVVKVPYFGVIGDFDDVATDGDPLTPKKLAQTTEQNTVVHSGLAFEVSRWARSSVGKDIYTEGAEQTAVAVRRKMDSLLITAACAAGGLVKDVYSSSTPRIFDYDLGVDAKMLWGDEQDDIVAMVVHSKCFGDMLKMKDATGRPLLIMPGPDSSFPRFLGVPVGVSDKLPVDGSSMSAVTASGTTPPTVTLSGTPLGGWNLVIEIQTGGSLGAATFRFSTDGGVNWSADLTTGASVPLIDTAIDSLVGVNGKTGVTAAFASGTYNADNAYTATASLKLTTLLLKSQSLCFWWNRDAMRLLTDQDILAHTDVAAMHLYAVAHRYRRRRGGTKPGVVRLRHN